ncbi:hypothetical protein Taro_026186 [Colocasia esculenta]|uniref:Uncharacterized protein n=1 Tax=Colocasia esculenta TaxID=4460 RepID=A0A843VIU1_COLES|nr:hypothetical protein [Colocasia esculenta]
MAACQRDAMASLAFNRDSRGGVSQQQRKHSGYSGFKSATLARRLAEKVPSHTLAESRRRRRSE